MSKPGYNGYMASVNVNLGEGAFRIGKDFDTKDDVFGVGIGVTLRKEEASRTDDEKDVEESASSQSGTAAVTLSFGNDATVGLEEYGYGFWLRFLTTYPERLIQGKKAPWYFLARLTNKEKYDDVTMGDRILAIW